MGKLSKKYETRYEASTSRCRRRNVVRVKNPLTISRHFTKVSDPVCKIENVEPSEWNYSQQISVFALERFFSNTSNWERMFVLQQHVPSRILEFLCTTYAKYLPDRCRFLRINASGDKELFDIRKQYEMLLAQYSKSGADTCRRGGERIIMHFSNGQSLESNLRHATMLRWFVWSGTDKFISEHLDEVRQFMEWYKQTKTNEHAAITSPPPQSPMKHDKIGQQQQSETSNEVQSPITFADQVTLHFHNQVPPPTDLSTSYCGRVLSPTHYRQSDDEHWDVALNGE